MTLNLVPTAAALLTLAAGYALGSAIIAHQLLLGVVSGSLLATGIALWRSLTRKPGPVPMDLASRLAQREAYEAAVQSAPKLGELLVYKHQWIAERDLARALLRQRRRGGRLGEILVRMGAITTEQLAEALVAQRPELNHVPELLGQSEEWTATRSSVGADVS